MAHDVTFSIPARDLGRSDVEFNVSQNGTKLGTLRVSKGAVVWFPRDTTHGHKLSWGALDQVFQASGTRWERR